MAGLVIFSLLISVVSYCSNAKLSDNVDITWSADHVDRANEGTELLLKLDNSSGSGFKSKEQYMFGTISMEIKLVPGESAGTVTSFYLQTDSTPSIGPDYYEYDFEFLGNVSGEPYIVQTNVYAGGKGGREQRIYLWFDPTVDFHTYTMSWTKQHTVFLVDSTPVRVFKNNEENGIPYPSKNPMTMRSSLWSGEDWATRGGLVKTNWNHAPFIASFRNFIADACVVSQGQGQGGDDSSCSKFLPSSSASSFSSAKMEGNLGSEKLGWVRKNYMIYDYCTDALRYPSPPPECFLI
ncbi:hypothetical protein SELMODRAFT_427286 [Selaginella moellendorffii]|uniref:Xyloglucan endotransglucosylase/hydrolase n=1 Tax=Selaginella moellendorffii TaxID=88036 RepID=D8SZ42_SELML|nr:probable xyloglucan endotransglucosylase/hydrolase protein 23 [Selaginella moellendorffii]EFJ10334.1 hypothetical protein SELMODRAFT_427286 [Selaginella moellendorffii]|eukprot:XP_002988538.1 probable xyloglucan endotransglucosylase/hydrolase protein 23 [Selaginella moellendorffii]